MDSVILYVCSGKHDYKGTMPESGFPDVVEQVERTPRQHSRWKSVTYKGIRYQLMGGIRTNYWINLSLPIKGKQ